jgi:hypothetical protein
MTPFSTPVRPSQHEPNDFTVAAGDPDVFAAIPSDTVQRFADLDHQHHRHAAQNRSVRLRTIEQIRRQPK